MIQKLRQAFCNHFYVQRKHGDPYFVSSGDEYHNRASDHYYLTCSRCGHSIDVVNHWSIKEAEG